MFPVKNIDRKKLRVAQLMRDTRPNNYSIERVFQDVRSALGDSFEVSEWRCFNPSKGVFSRLMDALRARKNQKDVNHVTGDTHYLTYFLDPKRTMLTIHDLVALEKSRGLKRFILWLFWFWLPSRRCSVVSVVSEATRSALIKSVNCDPNKVLVIHNPVSVEFQATQYNFNTDCPRILQIGTGINKNLGRVAIALEGLRCELVIVGPLDSDTKDLLSSRGIRYQNHVGLDRMHLVEQYRQSDLVIFVSTYEGFGLPIVEANAVGRPVITSYLAPMTEIAGDAACYVDPFDSNSIRSGVEKIINDEKYRESLVSRGFENALRFERVAISQQYGAVYRYLSKQGKGY